MSLSRTEARDFLEPLKGKAVTFVLEGRKENLAFARAAVGLMAGTGTPCTILDLDAFYAANSDRIFGALSRPEADGFTIDVPDPSSRIERDFPGAFAEQKGAFIVDSLNSLYHLLSFEDGSSRSRKLSFAVASLSYAARTNSTAVILAMYRREGLVKAGVGRSISGFADATVSVEVRGSELSMKCERGTVWPGGKLSIRSPSGWPG